MNLEIFFHYPAKRPTSICQYQAHLVGKLPYSVGLVENCPNKDYRVLNSNTTRVPTLKPPRPPSTNERSLAGPRQIETLIKPVVRGNGEHQADVGGSQGRACIVSDLDTGGFFNEYVIAMILCGRESFVEGIDRKPAEFIPVDLDACVRATAALRLCMQGNPDVYREHIAAMDQGMEEEERRRRGLDVEVDKDDTRFRWWAGLRKC
jgi:hypothetical protein